MARWIKNQVNILLISNQISSVDCFNFNVAFSQKAVVNCLLFLVFKFDKITVLMITTWWLTIFDTTATNMITNYMILNQRVLHNHAYNYNIVLETWFRVVLGQNFCGWNNNSSNLDIINLLFRCANKWIKYSHLNLMFN